MFALLNFLGQGLNYFSYFSIGSRGNQVLNRVYIGLGVLGDLYLFYVGHRFIINQDPLRGSLIILVALMLVYWLYVNFYYYFLHREAPFDVSPKIAQKLGLRRFNQRSGESLTKLQNLPHEGAFVQNNLRHAMPARVKLSPRMRQNVQQVARQMKLRGHLQDNYGGLSIRQINRYLQQHARVYAIGAGAVLPYFTLRQSAHGELIYGGDDASTSQPLGEITQVGWQNIRQFRHHYAHLQIKLMSVILMGGPYWSKGRSHAYRHRQPYTIQVTVSLRSDD